MHAPIVQIVISAYGCALVADVIREQLNSKDLSGSDPPPWEEIVRRLTFVRIPELKKVANSAEGDAGQYTDATSSMLEALGGAGGLRRMQQNGLVLAVLARRIEDFTMLDDSSLVETIRGSALQLRRRVLVITAIRGLGNDGLVVRMLLRDVASLYCQMVSGLIELYAMTHCTRVQRLIAACNWHLS